MQSALGKAYARWRRVSRGDQPEAYVRRMVVNEVLTWRRRKASTEVPTGATPLDDPRRRPVSHESTLADSDAMWQALGQLAPRQRAVVVLRYYERLSEAEIADTLGVRPGTVKSQAPRRSPDCACCSPRPRRKGSGYEHRGHHHAQHRGPR